MAFENLLISLTSKLDESGFKALDRLENKAIKKTDILSNSLKRMFVGVMGTFAVKSIVDATVKLDTLQRSMAALAGSESGGQAQLSYLRGEAERLGQSFETIADSYKNLFAAGTGAGWTPTDIQTVFSSILEAGTVLGSSKQQIGGALLSVEQMISKGRVSLEELRRQLGNALPGAMQIAAKAMGVTSEQLQDMISKGIASEDFVKKFAATLHEEYGQRATESAHTLRAELERLGNAIFFLQTALLDGDNMQGVAEAIREIAKFLSNPMLLKSINGIGKLVSFILKHLKAIVSLFILIFVYNKYRLISTFLSQYVTLLSQIVIQAQILGVSLNFITGPQIIRNLKTMTGIFIAWLVPLLKIAFILGVIIELVDTLRGKPTATSEIIGHMPTLQEFTGSEKFQRGVQNVKNAMPWNKPAPLLEDSGNYNKDGSLKTANNSATVIINANSADSQQVANLVKSTVADMFNSYEEVYT